MSSAMLGDPREWAGHFAPSRIVNAIEPTLVVKLCAA
jgi:hypothetical protein